jgi:hypothetical protein
VREKYDWDVKLQQTNYTGGQLIPNKSELKRVLKRRKSRQSNEMQCTVDFDFLGSSANELIHLVDHHDKAQLNFELNLRSYRNKLPFRADAPWQYPATRNFSPENTLKEMNERGKASN